MVFERDFYFLDMGSIQKRFIGIHLYLGFQVVQEIIKSEKRTVDVQKVFGTPISVHFANLFVFGITLAQVGDLGPEIFITKVKCLFVERRSKNGEHFFEQCFKKL